MSDCNDQGAATVRVARRTTSHPRDAQALLGTVQTSLNVPNLAAGVLIRSPISFWLALRDAGATIVEAVSHAYPGRGLTCVLMLAESHAILHTWPESRRVNVDIFTCFSV